MSRNNNQKELIKKNEIKEFVESLNKIVVEGSSNTIKNFNTQSKNYKITVGKNILIYTLLNDTPEYELKKIFNEDHMVTIHQQPLLIKNFIELNNNEENKINKEVESIKKLLSFLFNNILIKGILRNYAKKDTKIYFKFDNNKTSLAIYNSNNESYNYIQENVNIINYIYKKYKSTRLNILKNRSGFSNFINKKLI